MFSYSLAFNYHTILQLQEGVPVTFYNLRKFLLNYDPDDSSKANQILNQIDILK